MARRRGRGREAGRTLPRQVRHTGSIPKEKSHFFGEAARRRGGEVARRRGGEAARRRGKKKKKIKNFFQIFFSKFFFKFFFSFFSRHIACVVPGPLKNINFFYQKILSKIFINFFFKNFLLFFNSFQAHSMWAPWTKKSKIYQKFYQIIFQKCFSIFLIFSRHIACGLPGPKKINGNKSKIFPKTKKIKTCFQIFLFNFL